MDTAFMELHVALEPTHENDRVGSVISVLDAFEKRIKPQQLILARYFKVVDTPRLTIVRRQMRWEFELNGGSFGYGDHETTLVVDLDPPNTHGNGARSTSSHPGSLKLSVACGCFDSKPCVHSVTCANYLRRQLTSVTKDEAAIWLQSCISDGRDIGRKIIAELTQIEGIPVVEEEAETLARIQWRIVGFHGNTSGGFYRPKLSIVAYLQSQKKEGRLD